jgi:hypothetical protein
MRFLATIGQLARHEETVEFSIVRVPDHRVEARCSCGHRLEPETAPATPAIRREVYRLFFDWWLHHLALVHPDFTTDPDPLE